MFPDVESITVYWYKYADVNEKQNRLKGRFYLDSTERKRFTRMKRIVQGLNKQMDENVREEIISKVCE